MTGIINSQTIPTWLVAVFMILTGLMWIVSRFRTIRMDSRIFAITFLLEGLIYGMFGFFNVGAEVRAFFVKLMIIILCLSQFVPLAVAYKRSLDRDIK